MQLEIHIFAEHFTPTKVLTGKQLRDTRVLDSWLRRLGQAFTLVYQHI